MAAPRASWKGFLKIAEVTCPVGLYAAVSSSERIVLHTVNRSTGNRVSRQYVDAATGEPVESEDQVKGYEVGKDEYVVLEPEEIAAAVPESDKRLTVSAFVDRDEIDDVYFDRPYFLAPSDRSGDEAFELIREGLRVSNTAAIAQAVLFRRVRTLLIRPLGAGLAATSLNFDYEVRSAQGGVRRRAGARDQGRDAGARGAHHQDEAGRIRSFASSQDRYEAALAELVKAKIEGRTIEAPKRPKRTAPSDLMAALRESAAMSGKSAAARRRAGRDRAGKRADDGARAVSRQAQFRGDSGAEADRAATRRRTQLRRPEARRAAPPLRLSPRTGRRLEELGGDARPEPRPRREAACGRGRGPSARIRLVRGHDPEGRVRRRRGPRLGPRNLDADRRSAQGARQGPSRIRARWARS